MDKKMMSLSEDQLFLAAVAYEVGHCDLPFEEFLLNLSESYSGLKETYKKLRPSAAKVGNKAKLGI